ncbi:MAG: stage IV sporulation protein A [Clostridia bacterium]|nr:stage IV sporulation protein A [Clostridia bacterium]
MNNYDIYGDIATRTNGEIYIGVVGPVRTGKSTFIKNFMNMAVIPNIKDEHKKERALDELPQSSNGKTIMTTEPKFVPNEAVEVSIGNLKFNMRMIDCVGYLTDNAIGHMEDDVPRMVNTPWSERQIPFSEAAEIGTKKVIDEHSTIGVVVTTDGSVTEFGRGDYLKAEERVINELKNQGKPFVVILNTENPYSENTIYLVNEMSQKYDVPILPINCAMLSENDINTIIENVLYEFPVNEITFNLPKWIDSLEDEYWLKEEIRNFAKTNFKSIKNLRQIRSTVEKLEYPKEFESVSVNTISMGTGNTNVDIKINQELFYKILSELSGIKVDEEGDLFSVVTSLSQSKRSYDKIEKALNDVKRKGYGIVSPDIEDLSLAEPEIVKQGSKFGVKLKAKAPSLHIVRAEIETEVSPIVGSEKQSEELVNYLLKEFEDDPIKIWESNIFGKSLHELVNEGLQTKLAKMPEEAQCKLQETLEKIINEGSGGLICIIL